MNLTHQIVGPYDDEDYQSEETRIDEKARRVPKRVEQRQRESPKLPRSCWGSAGRSKQETVPLTHGPPESEIQR
jgi:hypothetical protein